MAERQKFSVGSLQGPRSLGGMLLPIFSDTGYGDRDPATHIHGKYLPFLDPTRVHVFFDHFDNYVANDWTITEVGVGSRALADIDGGALLVTNAAGIADANSFNKKGESFTYVAGKPMGFAARFKVSDATQSAIVFGLQITDTTPQAVSDGIFFQKDDGDALIDMRVQGAGLTEALGIATLVNDTFVELQWVYDGETKIRYAVNGTELGSLVLTNAPSTELTVSFALQNGEAVAKNMHVDYLLAWKLR